MGIVLKKRSIRAQPRRGDQGPRAELAASPDRDAGSMREARAAAAVCHDNVVTIHAVSEEVGCRTSSCNMSPDNRSRRSRPHRPAVSQGGPADRHAGGCGLAAATGKAWYIAIQAGQHPAREQRGTGQDHRFRTLRQGDRRGLTLRERDGRRDAELHVARAGPGRAGQRRTDLFSLGSTLYAMCTGQAPFRATSSVAVLRKVCDEQPRSIRSLTPETPDWLIAIVAKLQAKEPDDRYQSAGEVAELLSRHLAGLQGQSPPIVPDPDQRVEAPNRIGPRAGGRRRPVLLAYLLTAAVAIAALITAVLLWNRASPTRDLGFDAHGLEKLVPPTERQTPVTSSGSSERVYPATPGIPERVALLLQQAGEALVRNDSARAMELTPRRSNSTRTMPSPTKCGRGFTLGGKITTARSPTSARR